MNHSPTYQILLQYYGDVLELGTYLGSILRRDSSYLVQDSDTQQYKALLNNGFVAPKPSQNRPNFEVSPPMTDMREVVERAQERLFKGKGKLKYNMITVGYRTAQPGDAGRWAMTGPGITNQFVNTIVTALQAPEWETLLERVGIDAMMHILTETSVFLPLPNGCLCQVTGEQLLFCRPITRSPTPAPEPQASIPRKRRIVPKTETGPPQKRARVAHEQSTSRIPADAATATITRQAPVDIFFDRSKLFYARATHVPHTMRIIVGFPAQHILNVLHPSYDKKEPNKADPLEDPKVVKQQEKNIRLLAQDVFPKQYGLNASAPKLVGIAQVKSCKTPKRLKDILVHIERMLYKHSRCAYMPLRDMACPSKIKSQDSENWDTDMILEMISEQSILLTQAPTAPGNTSMSSDGPTVYLKRSFGGKPRFAEFACSYTEVFRYVFMVTNAVIPKAFWGSLRNFKFIMKKVKEFISCRRFETLNLHDVLQGFSTSACDWLIPPGSGIFKQTRISVSDSLKRRELLEEFVHWYFKSFAMPLLRTTFYITESSAFRNRVLYFRQDDWEVLCAPLIERLSSKTFKRMTELEAQEVLRQRTLGFSFVRLLPKDTGIRPIVNLRRRKISPAGQGPARSINQILQGAFQVLTYEKNIRPNLLGASVFSPDNIYSRLKDFKERLRRDEHGRLPKLYFVKMDVQACFDTIDQGRLLQIIRELISKDAYLLQRHGQLTTSVNRLKRTYVRKAFPEDEQPHFLRLATELATVLRNIIFVDQVVYPQVVKNKILSLLEEHITENIVKIGNSYYCQVVGIPQGSVLSALLCCFFYGDLEKQFGSFTDDPESVLLRLIDDYLFITTSLSKAEGFVDMMSQGHPEYGCFIAKEKTLTNFDYGPEIMTTLDPQKKEFPWCGYLFNMMDLSVSVDYSRYHGPGVSDTLTVDRGRRAGASFNSKMLQLAQARGHIIYTDTAMNTEEVVYRNIYQNFMLSAMKMHAYLQSWGVSSKRNDKFIHSTMQRMIHFCYASIRSKATGRAAQAHKGECSVQKLAVVWLGSHAFHAVLSRFPQRYGRFLKSLRFDIARPCNQKYRRRFRKLISDAQAGLADVRIGV